MEASSVPAVVTGRDRALGGFLLAVMLVTACGDREQGTAGGEQSGDAGRAAGEAIPSPVPEDLRRRVEQLIEALEDRERRKEARKEIITLGERATPVLLEHMDDPAFTTRWEMANVQGYIQDPRAVPALVANVARDPNPHIRWRSMWALRAYPLEEEERAVAMLREEMQAGDEQVRWNAAVGLTMFEHAECRCLDLLHEGVSSPDRWRRWEAINALRRVHDERSIRFLLPVVEDGSRRERHEAVLALGDIGGPRAVEVLLGLLDDAEPGVRWRAAQSLGEIGDPRAREPLRRLEARETDEMALEQIRRALERIPETPDRRNRRKR